MILPGILSSQISGHLYSYSTDFYQIATATVTSGGATTITFSSIPGTYKHLQLRVLAASNSAGPDTDDLSFQFNGDTGANYVGHALSGNGSAASAGYNPAASSNRSLRVGANNGSAFGAGFIDILDYTNVNKNKVGRSLGGVDWNGGGNATMESLLWLNTAAITSMTIVPKYGTSWLQYSSFALYGAN